MMSQLLSWGGLGKIQEIEWNTADATEEMDVVLVNGKRVKCAPGLRFSDKAALSMAQQAGWILSWSKIEALERTDLHFDWVSKMGMEQKLLHFTNSLLKLEESRMNGEKIKLTTEQRKLFAADLCNDLIKPTGVNPTLLTNEGYFLLKKKEERTINATAVNEKKEEFAKTGVLPPVIISPLAMKYICNKNELLSLESVHEKSSIIFNPNLKNSTMAPGPEKSIINQEYEDLIGNLSNITLDKDIALGAMNNLAEQSVISEASSDEVNALDTSLCQINERYAENVQQMHVFGNKLNQVKTDMEDEFIAKQAQWESLNETLAIRSKALAVTSADLERIEREKDLLERTKNTEINELESQLKEAQEEIEKLNHENRQKVDADKLFEAEDKVADLQEKIQAQNRREVQLKTRIANIKLEAEGKLEDLKAENTSLQVKKNEVMETLKKEKLAKTQIKTELDELRREQTQLQAQKDNLELSIQAIKKDRSRISSSKSDLDTLKQRISTSEMDEVFKSPMKDPDTHTSLARHLLKSDLPKPDFIMNTSHTTKEVSNMLPKWTAGENVRNYTRRLKHAWEFVKTSNFDENKFLNLVRISVSAQIGELIDDFLEENKDNAENLNVEKLCQNLIKKLDKQPSEYISDFKSATKAASESHSAYAHRLKKLFKKGTETTGKMGQGECRLLVEQFLEGLPHSEATTLKLVANDEEMLDVDLLALRASRSGKPRKTVSSVAVSKPAPKTPDLKPQHTENTVKPTDGTTRRRGARFNCHFCHKFGHSWRSCFKRARENPNWRPQSRSLAPSWRNHQNNGDKTNGNKDNKTPTIKS